MLIYTGLVYQKLSNESVLHEHTKPVPKEYTTGRRGAQK